MKPASMRKALCAVALSIIMLIALLPMELLAAQGTGEEPDDKTLDLLMIGNSFTWDAADAGSGLEQSQLYRMMQSMIKEGCSVELGVLVKGSSTLAYHATCAKNDIAMYKYAQIGPSTENIWNPPSGGTESTALSQVLESKDWDIIVLQAYQHEADDTPPRSSYMGGDVEFVSPKDSIPYLLDYFAKNEPGADVYYYMPWSTTKFYGMDGTRAGYDAIAAYTEANVMAYKGVESGKKFAGVLPVGTAIENARSTYLDNLKYGDGNGGGNPKRDVQLGLLRDNQHISFGIGRYIAGRTVALMLIPEEMREETVPFPSLKDSAAIGVLPNEYALIAALASDAAITTPYEITPIKGYHTDPAVLAKKAIEGHAYELTGVSDAAELERAILQNIEPYLQKNGFALPEIVLNAYEITDDGTVLECSAAVTVRFGYTVQTASIVIHTHMYTAAVTAPTCTEQGYTTYRCTGCGESYVDLYQPMLEHVYSAGICTLCGHDSMGAAVKDGYITLSGELEEGTRLLLAGYHRGKQIKEVTMFFWNGWELQKVLPDGEHVTLFFLNEHWMPLRQELRIK